jgi:hypothetical protein
VRIAQSQATPVQLRLAQIDDATSLRQVDGVQGAVLVRHKLYDATVFV